eukprot:TRINITY_DN17633_c0_g1_i1.p1 TRINITY_DN17633_c0_g1~~TRINITY_DN17633_c0_g1_i1.p1  ORF type:complete len:373 (-),score=72.48 TRINITY_DN17633_c0_g1_i1:180-1298(-)
MAEDGAVLFEQIAALVFTGLIFVAISVALKDRGSRAAISACSFVASLVTTQLAMSVIEKTYHFQYPALLSTLHFSVTSAFTYLFLMRTGETSKWFPNSISTQRYLKTVVPVAISTPISVIFNNTAMAYAGAGLCAIIGTLAPVMTAILASVCGRKLSPLSWCGVFMAFLGGVVIGTKEIGSVEGGGGVAIGVIYAFLSLFGRCGKAVIMDYMIAPKAYASDGPKEEPLSAMHTLALCINAAAVISFLYALWTENLFDAMGRMTPSLFVMIALSALSACALNALGVTVLKELGASAQQIVGKLNTICIAAISVAFMGEHLPPMVVFGTALVLSGVVIFERGEHSASKEREMKKLVPTQDRDDEEGALSEEPQE